MRKHSPSLWLMPKTMLVHFAKQLIRQEVPDYIGPIQSHTWLLIHENLNDDQKNRLWEHHLHTDTILYSRLDSFLIFESVLLGLVGVLFSRSSLNRVLLITLVCLGIALTTLWGYVQSRQILVLERSKVLTREVFPEYQAILEDREKRKRNWPLSSNLLLNILPPLVVFIWIVVLIYTLLT